MSSHPWLPDKLDYADFGGNWEDFIEASYTIFHTDLIAGSPTYSGKKVILMNTYPDLGDGKHGQFWHIVSTGTGSDEMTKLPDVERLSTIGWVKPIINKCPHDDLLVWESTRSNRSRRNDKRITIWCKSENYVVVIKPMTYVYLLITAFTTDRQHTKDKLQSEYNASL